MFIDFCWCIFRTILPPIYDNRELTLVSLLHDQFVRNRYIVLGKEEKRKKETAFNLQNEFLRID